MSTAGGRLTGGWSGPGNGSGGVAADVRDAPRLVSLMRELGYQVTPDLMAEKLRALTTSASDKVMVATADDALIGCIGCHVLELLHAPGRLGRITAFYASLGFSESNTRFIESI